MTHVYEFAWDRRKGEPKKAYAGFIAWRDLGVGRTYGKAMQALGYKGRTDSTFRLWARRWEWASRADQWDAHVQRLADEAFEARVKTEAEKHEVVARGLLSVASTSLRRLLAELEADVAGKKRLTDDQILSYAERGIRLHRMTLGLGEHEASPGAAKDGQAPSVTNNLQVNFFEAFVEMAREDGWPEELRERFADLLDQVFQARAVGRIKQVQAEMSKRLPPPEMPKP